MTHKHMLSSLLLAATILGSAGCQLFDDDPTGVGASATDSSVLSNFIMGDPELDDWGAYYEAGDSFVRVDIPVAGALKVAYSTTGGWSGAIFLQTAAAVGLEIGLLTDDDGVTDVIDDVCVSSVEGGSFTSMPSNVEEDVQGDWTEYLRLRDDGSTSHWWPADAAFVFSRDETTACGVVNSDVQWELIPGGAFDKPAAASSARACPSVPAECVVQNTNDSGTGSLRQALDDLDNNLIACPTLTFADAIVGGAMTLTTGQLALNSDVTIDGCAGMMIDGNGNSRVMYVSAGTDVTLEALTITGGNGSGSSGGGIYNRGTLTIGSATTVSDNKTLTTGSYGGGIENYGTLTVYGTVSHNTARAGGGIDNYGTLTVYGTVSYNTAILGGGGIFNDGGTLTVRGGTVSNNTAGSNGGGMCLYGGTNHFSNVKIFGNHCDSDDDGTGTGGGVYEYGGSGSPTGVSYPHNNYRGSGATVDNYSN